MIAFVKLVLVSLLANSFQEVPVDTSYTLHSAFLKIRKEYPGISIPKLDAEQVESQLNVTYRVLRSRNLKADVYYPRNDKGQVPGIILIHGGGWRSGDKSLMSTMAQRLAIEGYGVMCPEYRLSLEAPYPAAVYDLKAAVCWMRHHASNYGIDSTEIVVMGCSAGGQLAALVGVTGDQHLVEGTPLQSCRVNAIVDIDGVLAFRHPDSQEGQVAAEWLGGSAVEVPQSWDEASALTYVNDQTPPTLFLASKHPRFLAGRVEFTKILQENGTPVATRFLEDAPHSFWLFNPWFEPTMGFVIEFLDEVFKR